MPRSPIENIAENVPLYKRSLPLKQRDRFKFKNHNNVTRLEGIVIKDFGEDDAINKANGFFEDRTAACVIAATGLDDGISKSSTDKPENRNLLSKFYAGDSNEVIVLNNKCLAVMAFNDFFLHDENLRLSVSDAILKASEGYAGVFGPNTNTTIKAIEDFAKFLREHREGNYDMTQMHLIQVAYRYYRELSPQARDRLVNVLLAQTHIERPNKKRIVTSGGVPDDYYMSGVLEIPLANKIPGLHHVLPTKILGETENHILTIHTARYLTNQLLYQQDHDSVNHDNRRNGVDKLNRSCTELMLQLLQNILKDDFSEYNAKNYQIETRSALNNLCTFAYDHEVRLAARMVLDYISAKYAISSNDLRRMMPFRRLNEGVHVAHFGEHLMNNGLVDYQVGADPMSAHFAIQAGNTRIYSSSNLHSLPDSADKVRPELWTIANDGRDLTLEAFSDYRIPPSIHDLFLNDLHRRFYQRLHRKPLGDPEETGRNCDNFEIYAGSPSYLISAGGSPATYAINPRILGVVPPGQEQQLGVALTTTFMPTTRPSQDYGDPTLASDLIQFSRFSQETNEVSNYGVAPDFACGHKVYLPPWCVNSIVEKRGKFSFINKKLRNDLPGFYLAILQDGEFAILEAFDTWLHNEFSFEEFKDGVMRRNASLNERGLRNNVEDIYTTQNGNLIHYRIWKKLFSVGAEVTKIDYGHHDITDAIGDAATPSDKFLHGTILNSDGDGVIEIANPFLGTKVILDMSDLWHPKRTSETGEIEEGGTHHEVWVNFKWKGPIEGDFFHPFNTLTAAVADVANGGTIKIMPGTTEEKPIFLTGKRYKIVVPIGGVAMNLPN